MDDERFEDLDSDEELLFDMDEDERQEHLAQKRQEKESSQYKGVHYEYDDDANKEVQEPTFQLHFEVPEGMSVVWSHPFHAFEASLSACNNPSRVANPTCNMLLA